jgi:hypothetical protein
MANASATAYARKVDSPYQKATTSEPAIVAGNALSTFNQSLPTDPQFPFKIDIRW